MASSTRYDAAKWVVDQIDSGITYFQDVGLIAVPEDFERMSYALPSCAVLIVNGENSNQPAPPGEDFYIFNLQVWFAVSSFTNDEFAAKSAGVYSILDDLHSVLNNKRPTGCSLPLVIARDAVQGIRDGLIEWAVEYRTGLVIGG